MSLSEEVAQIPITRLREFPDHPFYVRDDDMMQQLVESIRQVGVAYTICQHYGIDTSDYSLAYIAG